MKPIDKRQQVERIGTQLREELSLALPPNPDIERALRRLLERDVAEGSRPHQTWSGKIIKKTG